MSYLFAIWIVLTQSSTVIMPRRPTIIFDETVVSGTVLLLTPARKLKRFVQPLAEFYRHGLAILNFRSALIGGANRPDLPVRAASRVKSSRGSGDLFESLLVDISDWFELLREHRQGRIQVDGAPGVCARAYGEVIRIAGPRSMLPDPRF